MLPLDGLLVVSLEHAIAAPLATRHLADLGARVIKIERPEGGDFARAYDQRARTVWPEPGDTDEYVVGNGSARLDLSVLVGHIAVRHV